MLLILWCQNLGGLELAITTTSVTATLLLPPAKFIWPNQRLLLKGPHAGPCPLIRSKSTYPIGPIMNQTPHAGAMEFSSSLTKSSDWNSILAHCRKSYRQKPSQALTLPRTRCGGYLVKRCNRLNGRMARILPAVSQMGLRRCENARRRMDQNN